MSILLSAYFKEGIVFTADRNATIFYETSTEKGQYVKVGSSTKVLSWPHQKAIIGFCGLGDLAGLSVDEWLRIFIAETRDYDNIDDIAIRLRDRIQEDFDKDFPNDNIPLSSGLIIHLGGFKNINTCSVPVMYYLRNIPGLDQEKGYQDPQREFLLDDAFRINYEEQLPRTKYNRYPEEIRLKLEEMEEVMGLFHWFNNGLHYPAFNVLKRHLWHALNEIKPMGLLPETPTMDSRIAFCEMAVKLFGSFFEHHYLPEYRGVGGGADSVFIQWPD